MVAMGGGVEIPQRGRGGDRELLLFTQPNEEKDISDIISEIKDEFPNLDVHFEQVGVDGKADIPKGNQTIRHEFSLAPFPIPRVVSSSIVIQRLPILTNLCRTLPTCDVPINSELAPFNCIRRTQPQIHPIHIRRREPHRQASHLHRLQDSLAQCQRSPRPPDSRMGCHDVPQPQPQIRSVIRAAEAKDLEARYGERRD